MNITGLIELLKKNGYFTGLVFPGRQCPVLVDTPFEDIPGIFHDSRELHPGSLYVCLRGSTFDGHDFTKEAKRKGACAILCEEPTEAEILHVLVKNTRNILGETASSIYGDPCSSMKMIAVTGTNGKSTTAFMLRSIFKNAGVKQGMLGTVVYDDGSGSEKEAVRTTPEATDIHRMLADMTRNGCKSCVMETSSHGLSQGRLKGCFFDGAVFTNLTPEHLDYHGSMEDYFNSKLTLFREHMKGKNWVGVSNTDDPFGRSVKNLFPRNIFSFGLDMSRNPEISGKILDMGLSGITLRIESNIQKLVFEAALPVTGVFNAQNALGAAAVALMMGIDPEDVKEGLEHMPQVPGRLQRIDLENGVTALIDYAHTPDALKNVLTAVRGVCKGKIWSVFGLGGDRFQGNRPLMGDVAAQIADRVVVTMDNPRSEDPQKIAEQIVGGIKDHQDMKNRADWIVILDRKEAVFYALDNAKEGDAVLISGKGPEKFIVFKDRTIPYSDQEAVIEWQKRRGTK